MIPIGVRIPHSPRSRAKPAKPKPPKRYGPRKASRASALRRAQGTVVAKLAVPGLDGDFKTPDVLTFSSLDAFQRYLDNHPGTAVHGAKHVYRGGVSDITSNYQHIVDLHHYLSASKDILEIINAH